MLGMWNEGGGKMKGTIIETMEGIRPKCKECNSEMLALPVYSEPSVSNYYCEKCHMCYPMSDKQRKMEYAFDRRNR